ncbi:hypothetical protein [Phaffia rhodozyma]|uniref:Uncharacterized protein n=1 Tax=Phaffia rhodozyma TaxID=264483 RepID=A0A0F7SVU2_PHARH|nr:hypothetical protein [Phaffia rhodozyma]
MYPNRPVFLHSSALSPEEYPTFLSWVHDLRLPAGISKATDQNEGYKDDLACRDIRVDDVGRFLLESISLQESHWEEILAIFHPAHRSLQPRHSISQSHLRSLSPLSSEEVFVVLRLAWHALGGKHLGSEGQSLIFRQATPPSVPSQSSVGSLVSSPSSISSSRFSINNLSKLPPPPQHQARKTSVSTRTLPSTTEGKATSPMAFPSIYAKPSLFVRRRSTSSSVSDLPTASVFLPPPPPPLPPPQRPSRVVSENSSLETVRKTTEQLIHLSSASPLSPPLIASSRSSSSSSEDSDEGRRSGFDRMRYKTPMSDDGSSAESFTEDDGQAKVELLLNDLDPPQVASPNSSLVLIDDTSVSNVTGMPTVSSSNPFRARLHSASMLPPPEFSVRSQSLSDRPILSIVSPPLPPRPGLVNKPHSAPPLPPRESLLPPWSSSPLVARSAIESEPLLSPTGQKVSIPRETRSSGPKVPAKPSKLQTRPSSLISSSTGFHTTTLIQQSLLAAEDARKKEQTKAERERRVEVIGSSSMSRGEIHRSRSRDGMTAGLGQRESEGGSKWATVSAHTGLNRESSSKGGHHYHHYHSKHLPRSSISSFQALMKPPPPPAPSQMSSSSSSTSSSAIATSGPKNSGRTSKVSGSSAPYGIKPLRSISPTLKAARPESPETTSRVLPPPPLRRSSTLASLHSISSTGSNTTSTSQQPEDSLEIKQKKELIG